MAEVSSSEDLASLFEYLKNAESMLKENPEQAVLLVENVLEEIQSKESVVAMHQRCSRLLDRLIPLLPMPAFLKLAKCLLQKSVLEECCCHQYGSHVLQSIVSSSASRLYSDIRFSPQEDDTRAENTHDQGTPQERERLVNIFVDTIGELKDSWHWMVTDSCGTHVARFILTLLCGRVPFKNDSSKSISNSKTNSFGCDNFT